MASENIFQKDLHSVMSPVKEGSGSSLSLCLGAEGGNELLELIDKEGRAAGPARRVCNIKLMLFRAGPEQQ